MKGQSKIFMQLGAAVFLALLGAYIAAHARNFVFHRPPAEPPVAAVPQPVIDEEDPFVSTAAPIPQITGPVTARQYLVLDLSTAKVIAARDADRVVPIASLTKLVTAEVARQLMPADRRIEITDGMLAAYGSNGNLREGEVFARDELLYPLLLVSSNDAAEALAQGYGRRDFIRAMNDWAYSIGAYHTNFYDPSGLSRYTVSSAHDVALILEWIRDNDPGLLSTLAARSATVRLHTWVDSAHFLNLASYVGGKDGYIPEAGMTATSLFSDAASSAPRYLIVVLGSANRDNDVLSLLQKAETSGFSILKK